MKAREYLDKLKAAQSEPEYRRILINGAVDAIIESLHRHDYDTFTVLAKMCKYIGGDDFEITILPDDEPVKENVECNKEDIEKTILGTCLVYKGAAEQALKEGVTPFDFSNPINGDIFHSMAILSIKKRVDPTTVAEHLKTTHMLNKIGGTSYLAEVMECATTPDKLSEYIEKLKEAN